MDDEWDDSSRKEQGTGVSNCAERGLWLDDKIGGVRSCADDAAENAM